MATLYDLLPDAPSILALEPEELAGVAMELILAGEGSGPSRLHPNSFTSLETIGAFPQAVRDEIAHALAEGWNWLIREGLLAPRPGDTHGWHFWDSPNITDTQLSSRSVFQTLPGSIH